MRDAVASCFKQYATFKGRARRSEYWYFILFSSIINILTSIIDGALFGTPSGDFGPVGLIATLALLVPQLAVGWRRMHDTDRHGAKYLIGLIPVVGWILVIVWACQDSQPGVNRFGPSPKGGHGQGHGLPQQYGQPQQYADQPRYGEAPQPGQDPYGRPQPHGQDGTR